MLTKQELIVAVTRVISGLKQKINDLNKQLASPGLTQADAATIQQTIQTMQQAVQSFNGYTAQISKPGFSPDILAAANADEAMINLAQALGGDDIQKIIQSLGKAQPELDKAATTQANYARNLATILKNYSDAVQTPTLPFSPNDTGPALSALLQGFVPKLQTYMTNQQQVSPTVMEASNVVVIDSDNVVNGVAYNDDAVPYLNRLQDVIAHIP